MIELRRILQQIFPLSWLHWVGVQWQHNTPPLQTPPLHSFLVSAFPGAPVISRTTFSAIRLTDICVQYTARAFVCGYRCPLAINIQRWLMNLLEFCNVISLYSMSKQSADEFLYTQPCKEKLILGTVNKKGRKLTVTLFCWQYPELIFSCFIQFRVTGGWRLSPRAHRANGGVHHRRGPKPKYPE